MRSDPRVSIITLNWNGWRDTVDCLASLYSQIYENFDVIVVDNGSTDESISRIVDFCVKNSIRPFIVTESEVGGFRKIKVYSNTPPNKRLILIKNRANYGFAKGSNVGAFFAINNLDPKFLLFINNDIIIKDSLFLKKFVSVCEGIESLGVAGVKVRNFWTGEVWCLGGGRVNALTGDTKFYRDEAGGVFECDYVSGCCMLVEARVFKSLNGFNEAYFCYYEDVEFSIKCRSMGLRNVCIPHLEVYHKISRTSGRNLVHVYYLTRNRIKFAKSRGLVNAILAVAYSFIKPVLRMKSGEDELGPNFNFEKALEMYVRGVIDGVRG